MADDAPEYLVNPTIWIGQVATLARDIGIVVTMVGALAGLISKHDWAGLISYMQGNAFATGAAAVAAVGLLGYRQWLVWKKKVRTNKLVKEAPDKVAMFTTELAKPATQEPGQ